MLPLDAVLLSVLGCPHCKGALTVHEDPPGPELRCPRCRRAWPVEEGVPRLVSERERQTVPGRE